MNHKESVYEPKSQYMNHTNPKESVYEPMSQYMNR